MSLNIGILMRNQKYLHILSESGKVGRIEMSLAGCFNGDPSEIFYFLLLI